MAISEETLTRIQQFQEEYEAFMLWRDSLPEEEQELLNRYGANVLIIERKSTQPLPTLDLDTDPVEEFTFIDELFPLQESEPLDSPTPASDLVPADASIVIPPATKQKGRGRPKKTVV